MQTLGDNSRDVWAEVSTRLARQQQQQQQQKLRAAAPAPKPATVTGKNGIRIKKGEGTR